jgi:hypothetical protein
VSGSSHTFGLIVTDSGGLTGSAQTTAVTP